VGSLRPGPRTTAPGETDSVNVVVIVVASALSGCTVFLGGRRPGYHWVRQTISELGERGAKDGPVVSLGVFLPVGVVLAVVWSVQRASTPAAAALAAAIAVGYLAPRCFPATPGLR
jgi:hypothetical protein